MDITLIAIVVIIVIWYFGKAINSVVEGSGDIVSDEFVNARREQRIRLHKERAKQTQKVKKLEDVEIYSDKQFDKLFKVKK